MAPLLLLMAASCTSSYAVRIRLASLTEPETDQDPRHGNISADRMQDFFQLHRQMQSARLDFEQNHKPKAHQVKTDQSTPSPHLSPRQVYDLLHTHNQMQVREFFELEQPVKPPFSFASAIKEAKDTWLATVRKISASASLDLKKNASASSDLSNMNGSANSELKKSASASSDLSNMSTSSNMSASTSSDSESEASEEVREEDVKASWLANVDAPTWGAFAKEVLEMAWEGVEVAHGEEEAKAALLAKKDVPTWGAKSAAAWEVAAQAWEVARAKEVKAAGLAELAALDATTVWLDNTDAAAAPPATAPDHPAAPWLPVPPVLGNISGLSEHDSWLNGVLTTGTFKEGARKRRRE